MELRVLRPDGSVRWIHNRCTFVAGADGGMDAWSGRPRTLPAEQAFDVVVSDMGMGAGMNGWELAEAVKHRRPGVRFLLATGWGASIDPGEARDRGVEAVLSKPYQLVDLLDALAQTDRAA